MLLAHQNLRTLIEDTSIPAAIRAELADEFSQIESISRKLTNGEIHIAAFGRVGVGKSSVLNALLGREVFSTSPLHGETRAAAQTVWSDTQNSQVVLIDTPGIDELDGAEREQLAKSVSSRADIVVMVCEGDLTAIEYQALEQLAAQSKAVVVALNKRDRYNSEELDLLVGRLRERTAPWLPAGNVVTLAAHPRPETVIRIGDDGSETEQQRQRPVEISELQRLLWDLLEKDGKALAALNAALFARDLDAKVASRIVAARQSVADRIIRNYCMAKSLLIAVNPVPVADLLAAAGTDVAMVVHLGEVYGFRVNRRDAAKLLLTISAQMAALMGAYWGVNLISSALKTASAGLSTALTASAQGALAWYATYMTGKMAQSWFAKGKSWGSTGPRQVAQNILASLDRDTLIRDACDELSNKLKLESR